MRQCIFCPNKADTKEHVWSQWILDLLPEGKNGVFRMRTPEGTLQSRKSLKPDQTAKFICGACNNGWMSAKLEAPMKAITSDIILRNNRKTFSPADCLHITRWAYKTAILSNLIDPQGRQNPYFSEQTRHSFAKNLSIPGDVHVWIARRNAGYLTAAYRSVRRLQQPNGPLTPHLLRPPVSPNRFETYTCTFTVGFLILQVLCARWTERKPPDFPRITQAPRFLNCASCIWPNAGFRVDWPPRDAIDNQLFAQFWDRFENYTFA